MQVFNSESAGDNYSDTTTLQDPNLTSIAYAVQDQDVFVQLSWGPYGREQWGPEFLVTAGNSGNFSQVNGIRFRNATAGKVASVSAAGFTANEPQPGAIALGATVNVIPQAVIFYHNEVIVASETGIDMKDGAYVTFTPTDVAGSYVTYAANFVGSEYQHNDVNVAQQPILDFEDADGVNWTLTNDGANSRVKVTPSLGFGTLTELADSGVLSGTAASITFNSIPAGFMGLRVLYYGRATAALNALQLGLTFNADSGAHYNDEADTIVAGIVSNSENTVNTTSIAIGIIDGANAAANYMAAGEIIIPGYAGTTFNKVARSSSFAGGSTAANCVLALAGGIWQSTAAITSLTLTPRSGLWAAGSRAVLYAL